MPKTHTLRVVTGGGVAERKVDVNERLLIRAGTDLRSYKVQELGSVIVDEVGEGAARVSISEAGGRGDCRRLHGGVRLELGDEKWQLSELLHFELLPIPPKPKPPPEPLAPSWRLVADDGSEEVTLPGVSWELRGRITVPIDDADPYAPREREISYRLDDTRTVALERLPVEEEAVEEPVAAEVGAS